MEIHDFFAGLSALFAASDHDKLKTYLKDCLAKARNEGDGYAVVTVLNEMVGYYRSTSMHKEALEASRQVLAEMRRLGHEDSADFATTLLNVATAYRAAGEKEHAVALYEQALALYQRHLAGDDPRLAGLFNNISALHMESGEYESAADLLRRSLSIMTKSQADPADTATVYSNYALALSRSGKQQQAKEALHNAMSLFTQQGDTTKKPPHYAAALSALAETHYRMKDFAMAATLFEQAMLLIKDSYGENNDFAITAANCAMAHEALENTQRAAEYRALAENTMLKLNAAMAAKAGAKE